MTDRFDPTEEDMDRANAAYWIGDDRNPDSGVFAVLASIGPIIERERRAAKVEALREAARAVRVGYSPIGLETWADEIERGDR